MIDSSSRPTPLGIRPSHLLTHTPDIPVQELQQQVTPQTPPITQNELTAEGFCLLKPVYKKWNRCLLGQMHRHKCKDTRIMNNGGNMTSSKETNKTSITDTKEMKIQELSIRNSE